MMGLSRGVKEHQVGKGCVMLDPEMLTGILAARQLSSLIRGELQGWLQPQLPTCSVF